jgi:hypothetical protein
MSVPRGRTFLGHDGRTITRGSVEEEQLLSHVLRLARLKGWCAFHVRYSQGVLQGSHTPRLGPHDDATGWPDLVLVKPSIGILFRELKRERQHPTHDQERWGDVLTRAGGDWAVWKPSDEDRILAELGQRVQP